MSYMNAQIHRTDLEKQISLLVERDQMPTEGEIKVLCEKVRMIDIISRPKKSSREKKTFRRLVHL